MPFMPETAGIPYLLVSFILSQLDTLVNKQRGFLVSLSAIFSHFTEPLWLL